jgi:Ca2+-binding EF-hand superfamily protein
MASLSLETERRLSNFLISVIEGEKEIERNRIQLSENRDFEPSTAFRSIDRLSLGNISYLDIRDFLERNRIASASSELLPLIKQYDSDQDGRLTINEFHQLVLPSTSLVLRDLALNRGPFLRLSLDAELQLARLIEKELNFQRTLEIGRRDLALRPDFSSISAFSILDFPSTNSISREKIKDFLKRNGKFALDDDIDAVLRRVDVDGDERLSYSEFSDFLRTQEPPGSPRRSPSRSSPLRHSSPLRRTESPTRSYLPSESFSRSSYVRASPLTVGEESELVNIFFQQINLERDLNTAKKDVALCSDFNLLDAFQMFDVNDIGYVGEFDLDDTLVELGIRPSREETSLLFKHYSSLNNRRLTYSEFSKLFTPKEIEYSRILSNRNALNVPRHERRRVFSVDTSFKLKKVLRLHLESENVAESLRHRLARRPSISLHDAFMAVDKDRNGYITYSEFQFLLEQHGIFATAKDVESLMDRYDKDKDGRVSFTEFVDEVTPKSPSKY